MKGIVTEAYFLWHANCNNKIAYAPSIGNSTIKDLEKCKKYIDDFNYIFMREKSGSSIIEKLTGRDDIQDALDPTLLLTSDQWDRLTNKRYKGKKPYILCYTIGYEIMPIVQKLAKRLNMDIKVIAYDKYYYGKNITNYPSAGPIEFLDLIKNADFYVRILFMDYYFR